MGKDSSDVIEIVISRTAARTITPQNNDSYVIKRNGAQISAGTITINGTTITFKQTSSSATFTGTLSGAEIIITSVTIGGKSVTVTAKEGEKIAIPPMFWWGNYIPNNSMPEYTSWAEFKLDDLVKYRGESNRTVLWITEEGDEYPLEAKEGIKGSELAVKGNKNVTWNNQVGYYYFISPKSFGDLKIAQGGIEQYPNPGVAWNRHEKNIDGIDYYIYVFNITTSVYNETHNITFL